MWLRNPLKPDVCDDIKRPEEIAERKQAGWQEVPGLWMKHPNTGMIHFVDHPEHQKRLRIDGAVIVSGPEGESVPVPVPDAMELEIQRRVKEELAKMEADRGSTNDNGEPDHESTVNDQRSERGKRAVR